MYKSVTVDNCPFAQALDSANGLLEVRREHRACGYDHSIELHRSVVQSTTKGHLA